MYLQGVNLRITITVASVLCVSMLLVNFVLIIFWQRDALQREITRDQAVLTHVLDLLHAEIPVLYEISPDFFSFDSFYSPEESGRILLSTVRKRTAIQTGSDPLAPLVDNAISEAMLTGKSVVRYSGSFFGLFGLRNNVLVSVQPILSEGKTVGSAAVVRSLELMYKDLWQVEKTVLVYILINLLVLSVIAFFRVTKLVARPIERLVRLADQYEDQEAVLFAADSPGGEFGQLAYSLNSMLARIEHDRKSLEKSVEELGAANRKLKTHQQEMIRTEKLASVGRMAAGLAHEIGNPLGVVQGYLGLLGGAAGLSDEHRDFIRRADQELQRVNALIRRMLDFARVSKGEPEDFSLHELLLSVVDMLQVQPVFNTIKLSCRLDADREIIHADQDLLRQVFVNCLLNSADAVTVAGRGSDGVITVSTDVCGSVPESDSADFIRIQISDNGIGINEEQQVVIFDPFYTTKEPGKGTGLGLSVSLSIIESIGGKMEIKSKEGHGSVLSVHLPLTI